MDRFYLLGSKWLYLKIYTGIKVGEDLLIKDIYPIVIQLKKKGYVSEFFFIRYSDPDFHFRVRIKMIDTSCLPVLISELYHILYPLMKENIVWNLQYDTYKREIERYGGEDTIQYIERVFSVDSECIILLLRLLPEAKNPDQDRWLLAIPLIDDVLDCFGYSILEKRNIMKYCSDSYKTEFDLTNHTYKKQLDDKYRLNKNLINQFLSNTCSESSSYHDILNTRKKELREISTRLGKQLSPDVMSSIIHMCLNRLFKSKNRIYELVIYDFVYRLYNSKLAR